MSERSRNYYTNCASKKLSLLVAGIREIHDLLPLTWLQIRHFLLFQRSLAKNTVSINTQLINCIMCSIATDHSHSALQPQLIRQK